MSRQADIVKVWEELERHVAAGRKVRFYQDDGLTICGMEWPDPDIAEGHISYCGGTAKSMLGAACSMLEKYGQGMRT